MRQMIRHWVNGVVVLTIGLTTVSPILKVEASDASTDEQVAHEQQSQSGFQSIQLAQWLVDLTDSKKQENKMLDIAWADYQSFVPNYTLADLGTMEAGTTYAEIKAHFTPSQQAEVVEQVPAENIQSLQYIYKAEEGDLHPERLIEDWAQVLMIFIADNLVYAGVSTMSVGMNQSNAIDDSLQREWIQDKVAASTLADSDILEIDGLGVIRVDGQFYYGIGYPKMPAGSEGMIEAGLLVLDSDKVIGGETASFDEVLAGSFADSVGLSLFYGVENQVFIDQ